MEYYDEDIQKEIREEHKKVIREEVHAAFADSA